MSLVTCAKATPLLNIHLMSHVLENNKWAKWVYVYGQVSSQHAGDFSFSNGITVSVNCWLFSRDETRATRIWVTRNCYSHLLLTIMFNAVYYMNDWLNARFFVTFTQHFIQVENIYKYNSCFRNFKCCIKNKIPTSKSFYHFYRQQNIALHEFRTHWQ